MPTSKQIAREVDTLTEILRKTSPDKARLFRNREKHVSIRVTESDFLDMRHMAERWNLNITDYLTGLHVLAFRVYGGEKKHRATE